MTKIDPLTYGVDALRTTLVGGSNFEASLDALVLVLAALIFLSISSHLFSRIQI